MVGIFLTGSSPFCVACDSRRSCPLSLYILNSAPFGGAVAASCLVANVSMFSFRPSRWRASILSLCRFQVALFPDCGCKVTAFFNAPQVFSQKNPLLQQIRRVKGSKLPFSINVKISFIMLTRDSVFIHTLTFTLGIAGLT